jgi:hypothetical protein
MVLHTGCASQLPRLNLDFGHRLQSNPAKLTTTTSGEAWSCYGLPDRKITRHALFRDYNTLERRGPAMFGYSLQAVVMKSIILVSMMAALLPWQAITAQTQAATSATNDLGKAIFASRCGTCHDADASKKLPDGTTLLGRLAKNKDPETRLATRLKNEQERHQVFLYLQPMIEHERLSGTDKTSH